MSFLLPSHIRNNLLLFALNNPSDSVQYFQRVSEFQGCWLDIFGLETSFIDFFAYPFIQYFGFTYEIMMLSFTWIGFWRFVFGFLFFKENIPQKVRVFRKVNLLALILFLPNMHFWTASLGKGPLIFFGLMLFVFSFAKPFRRKWGLIIASVLIFSVRPHMFLLISVGSLYGLFFGKNLISKRKKIYAAGIILLCLFVLQDKILAVVSLDQSSNMISDFLSFSKTRSEDLSSATSGVNMAGYSLPEKIFTFWFRPLFIDAPGILGVIVSIENLIYLLLFGKILRLNFFKFWKNAPSQVKSCLMIFILTSFAMTFIMSNLGIMIRQKTMIMYFMFFVICYFLAYEKSNEVKMKLERLSLSASNKAFKI
ncbi:hypothetical protein [Christiangramia sediminis]|uniref:Uncharacterized protein n=1 Tax=Christiangramia sediminis TaxID=2881336 RepID=A0A9X1RWV5_9FLAO|nr:hypothetical protein [Christiangramia sediminis]MCB7480607.1 hypothetical protein [Christiangramia sediminis]